MALKTFINTNIEEKKPEKAPRIDRGKEVTGCARCCLYKQTKLGNKLNDNHYCWTACNDTAPPAI